MPTLDDAIRAGIDRDPSLAYELELAEAELRWAEQTAAVREGRGLTQAALGERSGMAQSAIARYERAGRTPTIATLWKLANALGATYIIGPKFYLEVVPEHREPPASVNGVPISAHVANGERMPADSTRPEAVGVRGRAGKGNAGAANKRRSKAGTLYSRP